MNQNLFILDDKYNYLVKKYEFTNLIKNSTDILVGNYLFNIFKIDTNSDSNIDNEYEIFSMNFKKSKNLNKKEENLLKILNLTENNICYYENNIYIKEELKNVLDLILKNKFSDDYIKFLLKSCRKLHLDIYDYIKKLDIVNFNRVYANQFNLIKYFNKPFYPINYCYKLLDEYNNKIAKEILVNMINLLKHFDYEIHPKLFDLDNYDEYEEIPSNFSSLHDLLLSSSKNNLSLFVKCINIFKLDYKNSDFIFILKNMEAAQIDNILKIIKESNIYNKNQYSELLLILNKINQYENQQYENKIENFNDLIYYLNKYNSDISFYYILDKYFDRIKINTVLSSDFTKIYLYFVLKRENPNNYIIEYIEFMIKNNKQVKLLINSLNKETKLDDIEDLIKLCDKNTMKDLLKINDKIKYIIQNPVFLFNILDNKDEDLFFFY